MSDTPKVGDEDWSWRGIGGPADNYDNIYYPCKILEVNTDDGGVTRYFVSYDSPFLGRRSFNIATRHYLEKVPAKVVSYQLMSSKKGCVKSYNSVTSKEVAYQWCRVAKHLNEKLFIQRTEVTGDKIEVFVEKVL